MNRLIARLLRIPIPTRADEARLAAAWAFVATGHADRISLSEFEQRFGITEVDDRCRSDYYRDVSPEEAARNRKQLDAFLAEKQ